MRILVQHVLSRRLCSCAAMLYGPVSFHAACEALLAFLRLRKGIAASTCSSPCHKLLAWQQQPLSSRVQDLLHPFFFEHYFYWRDLQRDRKLFMVDSSNNPKGLIWRQEPSAGLPGILCCFLRPQAGHIWDLNQCQLEFWHMQGEDLTLGYCAGPMKVQAFRSLRS